MTPQLKAAHCTHVCSVRQRPNLSDSWRYQQPRDCDFAWSLQAAPSVCLSEHTSAVVQSLKSRQRAAVREKTSACNICSRLASSVISRPLIADCSIQRLSQMLGLYLGF